MWGRLHSCRLQSWERSRGWSFRGCAGGRKANAAEGHAVRDGGVIYLHFWKLNYMRGGLLLRCGGQSYCPGDIYHIGAGKDSTDGGL